MMPEKIKFREIKFKRPKAVLNFGGFVMEGGWHRKFQISTKGRDGFVFTISMRVGTRLSIWEKFKCRFKQFCRLYFL